MIDSPKIYGVLIEHKMEAPLIMEGQPLTYEEANIRMKNMAATDRIIRVAMFKMIFVDGNESLIGKEQE